MGDSYPDDLLIDGDDDLLDYFLGAEASLGTLKEGLPLEEVNSGMSLLTTAPSEKSYDMDFAQGFDDISLGGMIPPSTSFWNSEQQEKWPETQVKSEIPPPIPVKSPNSGKTVSSSKGSIKEDEEGGEESEEKRIRRLAKNRESARQSRRRKKVQLETLEERVSVLTQELDGLRRNHLENAHVSLQIHRHQQLQALMKQSGSPDRLRTQLRALQAATSPGSAERVEMLELHFKHLFNLLMPPYIKFLLWMVNQGEDFFNGATLNRENGNLWLHLCQELNLSPEQEEKMKMNFKNCDTATAKNERQRLSTCLTFLAKLRTTMATRTTTIETHSRTILDILTPEQGLQYLVWIEENRIALDECKVGEVLIFDDESADSGSNFMNDPKFQKARQVLLKPESEMTMNDMQVLMTILDG